MHGVKLHIKTVDEVEQEKLKGQKYLQLQEELLQRYRAENYDVQNLELVNECLTLAPLDYTIWNYRSSIVTHNSSVELLAAELLFIEKALGINPKIYSVWEYRRFIINSFGDNIDANGEQRFIQKILDDDSRNFHCWNYKRWLQLTHGIIIPLEFSYQYVKNDFSNYSALYDRYFQINQIGEEDARRKLVDAEKELLRKCLFIAPNDESLWTSYLLYFEEPDLNFVKQLLETLGQDDWQARVHYCRCALKINAHEEYHTCKQMLQQVEQFEGRAIAELLLQQLAGWENEVEGRNTPTGIV